MKRTPSLPVAIAALMLAACTPTANTTPASPTVVEPAATLSPTVAARESTSSRTYANGAFALSFEYPADWFGPEEYVSGDTLRIEIGSDVVYPYGERPEQAAGAPNAYNIVLQFSRHNLNDYYLDTYRILGTLQDGQSLSGTRSLLTRVRSVSIGPLTGFEALSTLSESAQTDLFYMREVIAVNLPSGDLLDVLGQPVNVQVPAGTGWREAYRAIDEANLPAFRALLDSIVIQ